jgi:hypothetical protein
LEGKFQPKLLFCRHNSVRPNLNTRQLAFIFEKCKGRMHLE